MAKSGLWWASPAGALLLVLPVSLVLAWSTSDLSFRLLYRTPKLLTADYALLFAAAGAVLLVGVLLGTSTSPGHWQRGWPDLDDRQLDTLSRSATVCFRLTMVGYAAFGLAGAARGVTPGLLLDSLRGQDTFDGDVEALFAPVTGITTLTQLGVAYAVLAGLLLVSGRRERLRSRLSFLLLLSLLRSFFLTERLAIIEVVVPLLLVLAVASQRRGSLRASLAPVVALPGLVLLFGVFEYSRSWVFFRSRTTASYPEFVLDRLAGYYATAYNNGAAQLADGGFAERLPYSVLEALWTAPGVAQLQLYERLAGRNAESAYRDVLQQRANPEFNNPCGLCSPIVDLGPVWGLVWLLVAGLLVGLCWTSFRDGRPAGLLAYPVVFLGLLELPRYLYWTQGRLVPAALALTVVGVLLGRRRTTQRREPAALPALPARTSPALVRPG